MWHKALVEEEVNIGVLTTETSSKLGKSLEEDSRVSIVGNWVISKRMVDTLRETKSMLIVLSQRNFLMRKTPYRF